MTDSRGMDDADELLDLLDAYVLDADDAALAAALQRLPHLRLDLATLMERLDALRGDARRRARALVAVRAALGLSLVPGPPCRPRPLN